MKRILRIFVYLWTLPTTLVGLLVILPTLLTGGGIQWIQGVLEAHGGAARFFLTRCVPLKGGASAITLGHVVLGRTKQDLDRTREHERVHVRQAERWGPLFIPAYLIASAITFLRGGDAYFDNPFEREAYAHSMPRACDS